MAGWFRNPLEKYLRRSKGSSQILGGLSPYPQPEFRGRQPVGDPTKLPLPNRFLRSKRIGAGTLFLPGPDGCPENLSKTAEEACGLRPRIDGFVAHVASFRELEVLDYRELSPVIPNVRFQRCDLLQVPPELHRCCDSLSCLHVLEHIGLGRYGEPLDLYGHVKALENLAKMLAPEGILYLSVPFGAERIEYNAHRVFSLESIRKLIQPFFEVAEFSLVNDEGELQIGAKLKTVTRESNRYWYALAIFELRRRA